MFRYSTKSAKLLRGHDFWLTKYHKPSTVILRCNSSFHEENSGDQKYGSHAAFYSSLVAAVSCYCLFSDDVKKFVKETFQVHALKKQETE